MLFLEPSESKMTRGNQRENDRKKKLKRDLEASKVRLVHHHAIALCVVPLIFHLYLVVVALFTCSENAN